VGIILVEIGLGLRAVALVHIHGHGCVRSLQFLRAPSLLHDLHRVENAVGGHLAHTGLHLERWIPERLQRRLYRLALERAYLDAALDAFVVAPWLGLFRRLDALERRWCRLVAGERGPVEAQGGEGTRAGA
jgi:NAD(P)H-quinone oxidoreductase subunit 5